MLLLSRKLGESILIGEDIEIKVLAIDRGHVRIGISAPQDVEVDRAEIRERKLRERRNGKT